MSTITLSFNGQSIRFSVDDLPSIEAVLLDAARKPGQKVFRASATGRMEAQIDAGSGHNGMHADRLPGRHHFSSSVDNAVILTDC